MARKNQSPARDLYSVHPSIAYAQAIIDNLPEKTGRSMHQWIDLLKKAGPKSEPERREWLKKAHKLGGTTAWMIAEAAEGKGSTLESPKEYLRLAPQYVEAMYAGKKAGLRPIHDALIELGQSLGPDVKICPCQTMVPLYRHHVIAQIKPATLKRIDFGLALKGAKQRLPARLIDTGGLAKKDRITHRIPISSLEEIDEEVKRWLQIAYELNEEN